MASEYLQQLTADTSYDSADLIPISDGTTGRLKKISRANLAAGVFAVCGLADNQIAVGTSTGLIEGSTTFIFNGTQFTVGTTSHDGVLYAHSATDIALASTTHAATIGNAAGYNIAAGTYSTGSGVQARNAGAASTFSINPLGGTVVIGSATVAANHTFRTVGSGGTLRQECYATASTANNIRISQYLRNDAATLTEATRIIGYLNTITAGAESARWRLQLMRAGTVGEALDLDATANTVGMGFDDSTVHSLRGIVQPYSTTGAILRGFRNDTSVAANDSIFKIQGRTNDTQTTTNTIAAEIEFLAANTIATDINPGIIAFKTTPTGVAAALTEAMRIDESQRVTIAGDTLIQATQKTPASASATGTKGHICHDTNYIYVCTATDTWKRAALSTW